MLQTFEGKLINFRFQKVSVLIWTGIDVLETRNKPQGLQLGESETFFWVVKELKNNF